MFGPLSDGRTHPEDDNVWPWPDKLSEKNTAATIYEHGYSDAVAATIKTCKEACWDVARDAGLATGEAAGAIKCADAIRALEVKP